MGLGREIDHRVDGLIGKHAGDAHRVGDVPVLKAVTRRRLDVRQVLRVAGIGQGIQVDDPVFRMPVDPVADEIGPDKTGAAGYQQSAHVCSSFSILLRLSRQCGMGAVSRDWILPVSRTEYAGRRAGVG